MGILTVDDGPSLHTKEKIDFLMSHDLQAVFFCRGENILKYESSVISTIEKGFLVGNHSFSHPYFSQIPFEECVKEIHTTDLLIDNCYKKAGRPRPVKLFRFPFADRGAGPFTQPTNEKERDRCLFLQDVLRREGFQQGSDGFYDVLWDIDTCDYKKRFIENSSLLEQHLAEEFRKKATSQSIILVHDFDHNAHTFFTIMRFFLSATSLKGTFHS